MSIVKGEILSVHLSICCGLRFARFKKATC